MSIQDYKNATDKLKKFIVWSMSERFKTIDICIMGEIIQGLRIMPVEYCPYNEVSLCNEVIIVKGASIGITSSPLVEDTLNNYRLNLN